eukprot:2678981-Prorocentrum_lima.AAC.1
MPVRGEVMLTILGIEGDAVFGVLEGLMDPPFWDLIPFLDHPDVRIQSSLPTRVGHGRVDGAT